MIIPADPFVTPVVRLVATSRAVAVVPMPATEVVRFSVAAPLKTSLLTIRPKDELNAPPMPPLATTFDALSAIWPALTNPVPFNVPFLIVTLPAMVLDPTTNVAPSAVDNYITRYLR